MASAEPAVLGALRNMAHVASKYVKGGTSYANHLSCGKFNALFARVGGVVSVCNDVFF